MKICGVVVLYNPSSDINKRITSYISKVDKLFVVDNSNNDNFDLLLKDDRLSMFRILEIWVYQKL